MRVRPARGGQPPHPRSISAKMKGQGTLFPLLLSTSIPGVRGLAPASSCKGEGA